MIVTKEIMRKAASERGGFTALQIRYAQKTFPGQWKRQLMGSNVTDEWWDGFANKRKKPKQKKIKKPEVINKVSIKKDDWAWRPENSDIPPIKISNSGNKNSGKRKGKRNKVSKRANEDFYRSREWLELRVRVLEKYECKCMMCGRNPKDHCIVIHVDHIKPRSRFPELSLTFDNLQLLCAACNKGKSNKYSTDWRPDDDFSEELDLQALANSPI